MTAKIRIEKADSTSHIIMVQIQVVNHEGKWVAEGEPKPLQFPAQLVEEHLHQNKRVIVYEMQLGNA